MIEAILETAVSATVGEPPLTPLAADRADSAGFEETMAGALQPPEGGCQCDARASMAAQGTAGPPSRVDPLATARSTPTTGAALARGDALALDVDSLASRVDALATSTTVDRSAPISPEGGKPASCGSCGLPFSLDDVAESAIDTPVPSVAPLAGIVTGWTFANPTRPLRSATFEV